MPTLPGTRIRDNGVLGSITDNPLTIAATVMNSPDLADLSMIISGQQHALITLDPFKQFGDPEIVMVTFHGPASTTATIQRGIYGTPARQHPQGTLWTHAAADADFIEIVTSSTRPTDPYEGQFIYETDTNEVRVFDGTNWVEFGGGGGSGSPVTLGYAQVTANQGGITAQVDVTGLAVTVTVPEGRRIKVTAQIRHNSTLSGSQNGIVIQRDGSNVQLATVTFNGAQETIAAEFVDTPSAGTHIYKLQAFASSGTMTMSASATNPAFILVEDITGDPLPYDPASVPVGQLAYAEVPANVTGITNVNVNLLTLNVVVPAGRILKIIGAAHILSTVANDEAQLGITIDGVEVQYSRTILVAANRVDRVTAIAVEAPSDGAHTIVLRAIRSNGTGSLTVAGGSSNVTSFLSVEDITPTPAPASGAPASTLGYAPKTDLQGGITTETALTGLSTTVTVPAGRRLKITSEVHMGSTTATDVLRLNIKEGGTYLQIRDFVPSTTGNVIHGAEVILTPSAGMHTYTITVARQGGTGTVTAGGGATFPAFILVEDITGAVFPEGSDVSVGMIASEPWTSWSPTWTNFTPATSIITAKYVKIGRTVHWRMSVVLAGAFSVGDVRFNMPIQPATDYFSTAFAHWGIGELLDAGTSSYLAYVRAASATLGRILYANAASNNNALALGATAPFTWVAGDGWDIGGTYEAAS